MTERKYTAPMSGEKRKKQVTDAALKLAKKGGRVTLAAVATACNVTAPLVATYLGRGGEFDKSIRKAAAAAKVKLPDNFCVQGNKSKQVKAPAKRKPLAAKQVKAIKDKAAAPAKPKRIPKPKAPSVVVPDAA